jgi:hypothetical protein
MLLAPLPGETASHLRLFLKTFDHTKLQAGMGQAQRSEGQS